MKTCPRCGAENLQTAVTCRLCASPIETPEDLLSARAETPLADRLPPDLIVSPSEPPDQRAPASSHAGHTVCPTCEAVNEPDWDFCEYCGADLKGRNPVEEHLPVSGVQPSAMPADWRPDARESAGSAGKDRVRVTRDRQRPAPDDETPQVDLSTGIVCDTCGSVQSADSDRCSACGARLAPESLKRLREHSRRKPRAARLTLIAEGGKESAAYPVDGEEFRIGRVEGDATFGHDTFMSSRHAHMIYRDGRYFLIDDNSRNGTFVRLSGDHKLEDGDVFLAGKQLFRFERKK